MCSKFQETSGNHKITSFRYYLGDEWSRCASSVVRFINHGGMEFWASSWVRVCVWGGGLCWRPLLCATSFHKHCGFPQKCARFSSKGQILKILSHNRIGNIKYDVRINELVTNIFLPDDISGLESGSCFADRRNLLTIFWGLRVRSQSPDKIKTIHIFFPLPENY